MLIGAMVGAGLFPFATYHLVGATAKTLAVFLGTAWVTVMAFATKVADVTEAPALSASEHRELEARTQQAVKRVWLFAAWQCFRSTLRSPTFCDGRWQGGGISVDGRSCWLRCGIFRVLDYCPSCLAGRIAAVQIRTARARTQRESASGHQRQAHKRLAVSLTRSGRSSRPEIYPFPGRNPPRGHTEPAIEQATDWQKHARSGDLLPSLALNQSPLPPQRRLDVEMGNRGKRRRAVSLQAQLSGLCRCFQVQRARKPPVHAGGAAVCQRHIQVKQSRC